MTKKKAAIGDATPTATDRMCEAMSMSRRCDQAAAIIRNVIEENAAYHQLEGLDLAYGVDKLIMAAVRFREAARRAIE